MLPVGEEMVSVGGIFFVNQPKMFLLRFLLLTVIQKVLKFLSSVCNMGVGVVEVALNVMMAGTSVNLGIRHQRTFCMPSDETRILVVTIEFD